MNGSKRLRRSNYPTSRGLERLLSDKFTCYSAITNRVPDFYALRPCRARLPEVELKTLGICGRLQPNLLKSQ
jgi:hypothetical protein